MKTEINSFEKACEYMGTTPEAVLPESLITHLTPDEIAYRKLKVIIQALNKEANDGVEWVPDWNNWDQYKYRPWFDLSGSAVSCDGCDRVSSASAVGSRLCFISWEVCKYAATRFVAEYTDFFMK